MRTLQRTNLYEQVAREICSHIVQKELQVGEKLPSEQELCIQLGVSRASVREGLRLLQILGVTEPRVGEGTYIRDTHPNSVFLHLSTLSEPTRNDLLDLVEVMEILELRAVHLAIIRLTPEKLEDLKSALDAFKTKFGTDESCAEEDMAFHRGIFQSADNRLLLQLLHDLEGFLREALRKGIRAESPEVNYQRHKEVYDALQEGDEEKAVSLMKEHMIWTAKNVLESTALKEKEQDDDMTYD